jgi:hypothetical protein
MEYQAFGDWLRHRRLKLDISPFKMAEELGYKRVSAIYNFEYGVAPLPMSKWPAMARVLELSLEEFLSVMQRYAPLKVSEFRGIQSTGAIPVKENRLPSNDRLVLPALAEGKGEGFRDYHLEGAESAVVVAGPVGGGVFRLFDEMKKDGKSVGFIDVFEGRPFPGASLVNRLKEVSLIGILIGEKEEALEPYLKAAFLDALTGTAGYPHIHRVPKFITGLLEEESGRVDAENIRMFLGLMERSPEARKAKVVSRTKTKA